LAVDKSLDDSGTRLPTVRTRPTIDSAFGEPTILWEISTGCEQVRPGTELAALDLSLDGRSLYLGCSDYNWEAGSSGPLLMFERPGPGTAFELPPEVVGEVGISIGLTRDELTAYGTSLDPAIGAVVWYHRSSLSEPFGPAKVAPGAVSLSNPEPSPDGLALWGVVNVLNATRKQLAVSRWNEETQAYETPTRVGAAPSEGSSDASPALSSDCRSVYFTRYSGAPSALSQILIARR
jgi:hypothetical protein